MFVVKLSCRRETARRFILFKNVVTRKSHKQLPVIVTLQVYIVFMLFLLNFLLVSYFLLPVIFSNVIHDIILYA